MNEFVCPSCCLLGDDVDCRHTPQTVELARAFAVCCQQPDPTDEQIGYFIDDADAVIDDVGPSPWIIERLDTSGGEQCRPDCARYDSAFLVNGRHVLAIDAGEGYVEAHFVCSLLAPSSGGFHR